jgi:polyhydroxyalkanoate synthesis regulator phasin
MTLIFIILLVLLPIIILLKIRDKKLKDNKLLETVTKSNRGTETERDFVLKLLKAGFSSQTIFHDLYLKNQNGKHSQIDLVLATKVGIIVFEVKNYSGWIFGSGNQNKWTQVLAYGKQKYYFYNPVLQNKQHIEKLKNQLVDFQNIPFFSVVVFFGDCEFKDVSFIPNNTFITKSTKAIEVVKMIIEKNEFTSYKSKRDVVNVLSSAVTNGDNDELTNKHVQNIKDMLGEDRVFH